MRFEENVEDLLDDVEIMVRLLCLPMICLKKCVDSSSFQLQKFYEEQRSQNKSEQKESAKQKSSVVNDIKKFIGDE